jgi:Stage II sporulation protein E (SpoIIE)
MASRTGAFRRSAPPASLALAASILLALPPSADSAKRTRITPPAEATPTVVAAAEPVSESEASKKAEKRSRRANQPAVPTESPAAKRNANRKASSGTESAGASASPQAAADTQTVKAKERKEREREQRRREHEARKEEKEGHKETRKEREAREAEEARGHETSPAPEQATPVALAAAVSASPVASQPAATSGVTPQIAVASERAVRSSGGAHARHAHRKNGSTATTVGTAAPLALAGASTPSTPHGSTLSRGRHSAKPAHRTRSGSPLVTTVTKIIGVIPAWLWGLIGALGLLALVFAATSRVEALRARRLARQRQELLEDVGLLQAALLPELPERLGPVATTAAYRPASGPGAGGDFYDVFALQDGLLAVIVGDVSGHGRSALPHTTLLRYTLRTYLEAGLSPRESLRAAAPGLERQLGESFATVVLAVYDPRERLLTYSCAGHPHPIVTGMPYDASTITCSAPPLGAGQPTGTRQTVVSIPGEALACFYTDGVIEARTGGELYGQSQLAVALEDLPAQPTAAALLDMVREQTSRRPDDMAACLLGVEGDAERGAPSIRVEELVLDARAAAAARTRRFLLATGLLQAEVEQVQRSAGSLAAAHGSALVQVRLGDGAPRVSIVNDNLAPLAARAIKRSQEVAL